MKEIGLLLLLLRSCEIALNAIFTCSRIVSKGFGEAVKKQTIWSVKFVEIISANFSSYLIENTSACCLS
jgi:hypothetical protein